jgi:hypothetical protein
MADGRSWAVDAVSDETYRALATGMPASELWSLLLQVLNARAGQRTPAGLVDQWHRDGFVRLSPVDQRTMMAVDAELLAAAERFEAVELSPLAPLGACSVIGLASQNKIVSALRGTEVVSDPTNVLALECARRLRLDAAAVVRLATCHRAVRAQPVPKQSGFAQHFRIFCLASAGREQKDQAFVVSELSTHIATYLAALDRLESSGFSFPNRRLALLATPEREPLADRIAAGVTGLEIERRPLEHRYYDGLRFMLWCGASQGADVPLIDGGAFDWMGTLTANRKMVFVASGMGSQLLPTLFRL